MKRSAMITLFAIALSACGPLGSSSPTSTPTTTATPTPIPTATPIPTPTPLPYHSLGDSVGTDAGFAMLVGSFYPRATLPFSWDESKVYSAIGVSACAYSTNPSTVLFNAPNFALEMTDHTRWGSTSFPAQQPDVGQAHLAPSGCVAGFVTFDYPPDETPAFVIFTVLVTGDVIKWKLE
jgi:hypothetical protein